MKNFMNSVAKELGIERDPVPRSQIYFGYKDRAVMSVLDGEAIQVKDHLLYANKEEAKKVKPTAKQAKEMLSNPMESFWYLYECEVGKRSTTMIRAMKHAIDLQGTYMEIKNMLEDAMEYWSDNFDEDRYEKTIHSQLKRHFGI